LGQGGFEQTAADCVGLVALSELLDVGGSELVQEFEEVEREGSGLGTGRLAGRLRIRTISHL